MSNDDSFAQRPAAPVWFSINPFDTGYALILPIDQGRSVFCFDPQHGPSEARLAELVDELRRLGHIVVIGNERADQRALSIAAMEAMGL